jgi:hypothetical protein
MPPPKKSPSKSGAAQPDDDAQSTLAAVRELLTRSLMLPSDRLRETLDDAVRRGRITRADAEELIDRLVSLGRGQTDDALSRIESLVGGSRGGSGGSKGRGVVRRPPGTDRVLREVDRARRAAGLGSSFPISSYDDLTAAQISERLDEISHSDLRKVRDYEKRNANRKSVLGAIERRLR